MKHNKTNKTDSVNAMPNAEVASILDSTRTALQALARTTEDEVKSLAKSFSVLTSQIDPIVKQAAAIVACVENDNVVSVLPRVRSLGAAARRLMGDRLEATGGILDAVSTQVNFLRELSQAAGDQSSVALKIRMLSVLTNIEVARLGPAGADLLYLSRDLAEFSKALTEDTQQLTSHTDAKRIALEETRQVLILDLPRLREKFSQIEAGLGGDLARLESDLSGLADVPAQFRKHVEDIAQQIGGVITAVQSHDITRQQLEHVETALELMAAQLRDHDPSNGSPASKLPGVFAGLTIQVYQLKTIRETVANWASQVRNCIAAMLRISASEMARIGPAFLQHEKEIAAQLTHIQLLEGQSQVYGQKIRSSIESLSGLMQLVNEHLQKSTVVRDQLQLLTFNSIIKSRRLGTQSLTLLAISQNIDETAVEWARITERSAHFMREILDLVKKTNAAMEAFSEAGNEKLREAQAQTGTSLESLRSAAAMAAGTAHEMNADTGKLQAKVAEMGPPEDLLASCFGQFDWVLGELEQVKHRLEIDDPDVRKRYNKAEVEQIYSPFYTTEMERHVLQAALHGTALPIAQPALAGNSVELF